MITLVWPNVTAVVLLVIIASWAIVNGLLTTVMAIRFRKVIENEWLLIISGLLSVILGVLLVLLPSAGILSLVWLLGAFALVWGITLIIFSFRVRNLRR